jgi:hypothetical protein
LVGVVVNIFITSIVCINIHFELKLSRTLNFRMVSEGGFTTLVIAIALLISMNRDFHLCLIAQCGERDASVTPLAPEVHTDTHTGDQQQHADDTQRSPNTTST